MATGRSTLRRLVGSRLTRLGTKSLTTGYGIFRGDECIATSEAVNVFYDMATRRTTVPPAEVRALLERELESPAIGAGGAG